MLDFTEKQRECINYFKSNLDEFLNNNLLNGKFVIISNSKIQRSFDSFGMAIDYAVENFEKGSYIIQEIADPREINNFIRVAV